MLRNKKIVVALTASIAAVEAFRLIRELKKLGAEVYCIATKETFDIIGRKALEFTADKVMDEISGDVEHVSLYNNCDLLIIYPATANIISKISSKIADNIVNTTALVFLNHKPIIIAPAMHINMYENIREHLEKLSNYNHVYILQPRFENGKAKIAKVDDVIKKIFEIFNKDKKRVLILNGATAEFIDDVRVITNLSSGKMGNALAEALLKYFNVEMILGIGEKPRWVKCYRALTSEEMLNKALDLGKDFDIIISSAAISDFITEKLEGKVSSDNELIIKLKPNKKILKELRKRFKDKIIIGFKAEYNVDKDELIRRAKRRMEEYGLDMIIANDLSKYYFGSDETEVYAITKDKIELISGKKREVAEKLAEIINVITNGSCKS
ncbi:phosphopantothenoylcysteine decarboxylase/phosphopantothenate/cysteine ligase [Methanocaldococcus villosus KIN24-T80]|uniref:Coenzyme A biosynthesis bifunctional protein CoaBC n=1 Tax=Methanocaldococcus villosus KIN24-T80 TaxID=1069083 RepID=N6VU99_9EURY|nr:bifunctional phosphopantothenoylcysteine decarboxylase/phosphopantothenate--cysteine ligase CoaBC [Methanocaldococcus villosus]ENN96771.1 phosphopantothenoylcysteine decarboxylase/phosphopantothenate/cysteine ligase [Methanocaldococcus villosus KIN24-T80]